MSFIYALIAKQNTLVLSEYTSAGGNFQSISRQILQQANINRMRRITTDRYNFDFLKEGSLTFMAMTEPSAHLELVYAFLTQLRQAFLQKFNYQRIDSVSSAYSLDDQFSPTIRLLMIRYNSDGPTIKTKLIIQDLEELKDIVVQNLADVLDRGEKIDLLVKKADHLETGTKTYKKNARELRKKMTRKNIFYCAAVIVVVVIVVYIILVLCCGWKVESC